jgi:hypothetical protein
VPVVDAATSFTCGDRNNPLRTSPDMSPMPTTVARPRRHPHPRTGSAADRHPRPGRWCPSPCGRSRANRRERRRPVGYSAASRWRRRRRRPCPYLQRRRGTGRRRRVTRAGGTASTAVAGGSATVDQVVGSRATDERAVTPAPRRRASASPTGAA